MIGSLRGRLLDRSADGEILVEVGGVGYRVQAGPATAARLGDVDSEVFVWTHHHVREDAETLYGFASRDERWTFETLLGAHGVGPALALAILSVHAPADLARVVTDEDAAALCLVPGVGRKTAARLLIELKSRFDRVPAPAGAPSATEAGPSPSRSMLGDVRDALAELGYGSDEVAAATRDLADSGLDDPGDLLKEALRRLAGSR